MIYLTLTATAWGTAIAFYLRETTSWEVTPAHSRQYNQDCILLNFYDTHDIWHFLSAAAIFVGFMVSFLCTNILKSYISWNFIVEIDLWPLA